MSMPANTAYGLVTGRFFKVSADTADDPDRFPDGVPIKGMKIRFTPSVKATKSITEDPASTLFLDTITATTDVDGYLVDKQGQRGVYLVASSDPDLNPTNFYYTVSIKGPLGSQISPRVFDIVVGPDSEVDLSTVVPLPYAPASEIAQWDLVVKRAVSAVDEATQISETMSENIGTLVSGGAIADGKLTLDKYDGSSALIGPVGEPVIHIHQASDLLSVTKAGPAMFHYVPGTVYDPPLPVDVNFTSFGNSIPIDMPGYIDIQDLDALVTGVKVVILSVPFYRDGTLPSILTATAYQNYPDVPPSWSVATTGFPAASLTDTLPAYDQTSKKWVARYVGNLNYLVFKDTAGYITVPGDPQAGAQGLLQAPSAWHLRKNIGIIPTVTGNASAQPNPLTFNGSPSGGWDPTQIYRVNMNANLTVAFNPPTADGYTQTWRVILYLTQDATGGRTLTIPANIVRAPGFALSTAPNAVDVVTFTWFGGATNAIFATIESNSQGRPTSAATGSAVMLRDSSGRSQVATPSAANDIANKAYVDRGLPNPIATSTSLYYLVGKDPGKLATDPNINITGSVVNTPGAVPIRGTSSPNIGTFEVSTPTATLHPATKGYVDSLNVVWSSVPASATATGTAGQRAYDSDYLYICVATNTWKRVALSTW